MPMAFVWNQTDDESSGFRLKKYRRPILNPDLAAYRLLRNKKSARIKRAKESCSRTLLEENSGTSESF